MDSDEKKMVNGYEKSIDTFSGFTNQAGNIDGFLYNTNTGTGTGAGLYSCTFINKESVRFIDVLYKNKSFKGAFGFLLGTYTGDRGLFRVWVEDVSEVFLEENEQNRMVFSDITWQAMKNELINKRPDLKIIGFYHVKPDEGSLPSKEDSFIQEKFFSSFWQVSYLFDPVKKEHAFYGWDNSGNLSPLSFRVEGDEMYIALTKEERDDIKPKRKRKNKKKLMSGAGFWGISFAAVLMLLAFLNHYLFIEPLKEKIIELEAVIAGEDILVDGGNEEGSDPILPGITPNDESELSYGDEELSGTDQTEQEGVTEPDSMLPVDTAPVTDSGLFEDTSSFQTHTVVDGDNLWGISSRYLGDGSRYLEIAELNEMDPKGQLRVGDTIIIPPRQR